MALGLVCLALWACGAKPSEIRITPAKVTLYGPGRTQALKYEVCDKKGNVLPGMAVAWTCDRPNVATVDTNGLVRSLAPFHRHTHYHRLLDGVNKLVGASPYADETQISVRAHHIADRG